MRRLRGHPQLEEVSIATRNDNYLLTYNDLVTLPQRVEHWRFIYRKSVQAPFGEELYNRARATASLLGGQSSTSKRPAFYNIAILGDNSRSALFRQPGFGEGAFRSLETHSVVRERDGNICYFVLPLVKDMPRIGDVPF